MKCAEAKSLFSPYLDGAVTGSQMRALGEHLESCPDCDHNYKLLAGTQAILASIGRTKAPADLALKLRLAISHEVAQARRSPFEGLRVRVENAIQAFMVPATVGLISAIVIFGVLMGIFGVPSLEAMNHNDVPLMLYSEPELLPPDLQPSAYGTALGAVGDDSLVIEAYIGPDGRIQDYRILSDSKDDQDLPPQIKNMLIFAKFRPAMSLGRSTTGRAVLSFSKISVRG
jgi:hypothetical protein